MIRQAIKICHDAHKNQLDKSGLPYILHPYHLAEQMTTENEIITALLHDVIEDSDYTIKDLIEYNFNSEIIEAVRLLTHDKPKMNNFEYEEYILKIKTNPLATKIKLADLKHNADLTRLESTTDKDINRTKRYKYAIRLLTQNDNQDNSLIIDMPYGEIKIENAEQAAYFLKHKCDACPRNSMYNPCSGYYANICNTHAENIADHFRTI